jgi:hypothetical protein
MEPMDHIHPMAHVQDPPEQGDGEQCPAEQQFPAGDRVLDRENPGISQGEGCVGRQFLIGKGQHGVGDFRSARERTNSTFKRPRPRLPASGRKPGGFVSHGHLSALDRPASYQGGREGTAGEDVKAILAQSDMTAAQGNSSASFASLLGQDMENYRKIVQARKIKV